VTEPPATFIRFELLGEAIEHVLCRTHRPETLMQGFLSFLGILSIERGARALDIRQQGC